MDFNIIIIRLLLALVLSGLIGMEREKKSRPAGLRTHVLVCVSSVLVMLTSKYISDEMGGTDPARLGAQVISGIGFLGAGTIIRQGASIKGLTTAASLWAVACMGLAIGVGFYEGAIVVAIIIYFSLFLLRKFEKMIAKKATAFIMSIEMENIPGKIDEILSAIKKYDIQIKNIEFADYDDDYIHIKLVILSTDKKLCEAIVDEISEFKGVISIE